MPPPPVSRLQIEEIDGVTVVLIDEAVIVEPAVLNAVRDELYQLVASQKPAKLVLNLSKVRKYSTEFLGNVVGLRSRMKKTGGVLKVSNVAPMLMEAVKILQLDRQIEFFDEEQEAIDSF